MKIAILGWTSWFWKWLAKMIKLKFKDKVNIIITWRNKEKWEKVAKDLNVQFTVDNREAVKDADVTIVSVTIWNTKKVINEVWPYLKEGSIFADVTSVKIMPFEEMMKFSEKVLIIPTHPMFWPYISSLAWQVIILTPPDNVKNDERYKWFKNFLIDEWAKVYEISPYQHDKIMAIIQWLTHFSLFTVGETLRRLAKIFFEDQENELEMLDKFTSPVYKMLVSLVWRYMWQNPYLYAEIQVNNPLNKQVQSVFIETAQEFNKIFFSKNDIEKFVNLIESWRKFFWEYASIWQRYTDKIIFLLSKQIEMFKQNIWNKIKVQNIYTRQVKEWVLNWFDFNRFILDWEEYLLDEWIIL